MSRTDFVKKLSITSYAANKALNELLKEGYIERVGSGPKTRYRIPMSDNEWIANIKQMAADLKFEYNQKKFKVTCLKFPVFRLSHNILLKNFPFF